MKTILLSVLLLFVASAMAQSRQAIISDSDSLPAYRQMKCGLWINNKGDIAYKDMAALPPPGDDSMMDEWLGVTDYYIYWTYNGLDSVNDYMTELKNIVDTATFQFVGDFYFKDRKHVYILTPMAYGGHLFINYDADVKTFKALSNSFYACDKNACYAFGRHIEGADPKTFRLIPHEEASLSRDKNHFYIWFDKLKDEDIANLESELGISLLTHADVMKFVQTDIDSVKMTYTVMFNKEVDLLPEEAEPKNPIISEESALLTRGEIKQLNKFLLSEKSFDNKYAILSHADIGFCYYQNDSIVASMSLSSVTRSICLTRNGYSFRKSITKGFEKYIEKLLRRKCIWNKEQTFTDFN